MIVDSFPFLYAAILRICCLRDTTKFVLDVGEGLEIRGVRLQGSEEFFELTILNCGSIEVELKLMPSQFLLFLIGLVSDLTKSISLTGIDVFLCLRKFPVALI